MSSQASRYPTAGDGRPYITTTTGAPVDSNQNSITIGPKGPIVRYQHSSLHHFIRCVTLFAVLLHSAFMYYELELLYFLSQVITDFHLLDKLAHFDRERIPERVVHAKGAGAHGYFEVTHDITKYCKAVPFSRVGKRTPVFLRFSTVGGEKGSPDTARDPRGFSVKFYTEEGNWDMVGNNTPVFFIRDPIKFPDFIHTQKKNPQTNLPDANMFW